MKQLVPGKSQKVPRRKSKSLTIAEARKINPNTEGPGWICGHSIYIECEPTDPVRMRGEDLGGHEKAALKYLESLNPLRELHEYAEKEAARLGIEFNCWTDLDGHDIIKRFMEYKGFTRVAG